MMFRSQLKLILRTLAVLAVLFFNINALMAVAFPFREINEGDAVPEVTLKPFQDKGAPVTFSGLLGNPFIAVFWGGDLPEKIEHSAMVLAELETLKPFLTERGVRQLSVNVQDDSEQAINEVKEKSGSTMDLFVDQDQKAYATLGIFVMPTVLLVDRDGNVAAGMGYSRDLADRLKGAVEIMLGEKTAEQVEAELRPEMKSLSDAEKAARRHYDFGMVMLKRGQVDAAIREFEKAAEADPRMSAALVQLGCLYLERSDLENAEKAVKKALEADPDSVAGKICRAGLLRLKGELDKAAGELRLIISEHPGKYDAYYNLGLVYDDQKNDKGAMESYKTAYQEILKKSAEAGN